MNSTAARDEEAKRTILSYFLRHPKAADSLEGIAAWRIAEEAARRKVEETHRAVRWLLSKGYLKEVRTGRTGVLFTLNADRRAEAAHFLSALEDDASPEG